MKKDISKTEARVKIEDFFKRSNFTSDEMKKIKRLSMKYRISLKDHKKEFCKKCLLKLKGKIRITKTHKTITCHCGYKNRFKI